MKGKFYVIEGLDLTGKSSTLHEIKKILPADKYYFTREPGGTDCELSEEVRNLIIKYDVDPVTEAYLFAASRASHTKHIKELLDKGINVICDRYIFSSYFFQGILRGLGTNKVDKINRYATNDIEPDCVFYFKVSQEEKFRRLKLREQAHDRFDDMSLKVSDENSELYLSLIKEYTSNKTDVIEIDTTNTTAKESAKKIINTILR